MWWFLIVLVLPVATTQEGDRNGEISMDTIHRQLASVNPSWNRIVTSILESNHQAISQRQDDSQCCRADHSGWWCRRRRRQPSADEGDLHPENDSNQVGHRLRPPTANAEDTDWDDWATLCHRTARAEVAANVSSGVVEVMMHDMSGFPAIFSVLINFGRNQYYQFLLSLLDYTEDDHGCASGYVWDPFAFGCRRIYCGSRQQNNPSTNSYCDQDHGDNNDGWRMTYVMQLDVIQLTLFVDTIDDNRTISDEDLLATIQQSFTQAFASLVDISDDRMSHLNSSFVDNQTTTSADAIRSVAIDFWLNQSPEGSDEPTIDQVVAQLGSWIMTDQLIYVMDQTLAVRLAGLHEQPVQSESDDFAYWCAGGVTTVYMNDEFLIDVDNNTETNQTELIVYIKATDQWYTSDQYMANLFFYGSSESNASLVSGSVAVCENRSVLLDESCTVMLLNRSEYFIVDSTVYYNGSIPFIHPILYPGEYETLPDGSLAVCLDYAMHLPTGLIIESYIGCLLMSVSILAMLATVITYTLFDELRNLAGLAVMNLCLITAMFQLTIMLGMLVSVHHKTTLCLVTSIIVHYEGLASIFWTNVMAADLYMTLGRWSALPRSPYKILPRYALYAYGLPLVIVSITVGINFCDCTGDFEIEYGRPYCWINNAKANMIFFGLPLALALVANMILFVKTVRIIRTSSACRYNTCTKTQRALCQLKLYGRMSTVMGFAWVFAFVAACFDPTTCTGMVFTFIYIILNSMGGIFIFVAFTCTRRVRQLYAQLWTERKLKRSSTTSSNSSSSSSNQRPVNSRKMTVTSIGIQPVPYGKTASVETLVSGQDWEAADELAKQSTIHI